MNLPALPSGLHPEDYDRIEAAVMETVRGRWFLLEYARRQRAIETDRLMQAVERLERYAASRESALLQPALEQAEPESLGVDVERARDVVAKARDFARALRERGLDEDLCATADELAAAFGALAGEAAEDASVAPADEPVVAGLPALIEPRLEDLQPLEREDDVREDDVQTLEIEAANDDFADRYAPMIEAPAEPPQPEPRVIASQVLAELAPVDPRLAALSRLDHLTLSEKLMLFG